LQALIISRYGGPEVVEVGDVPVESPVAGEVLVQVAAVGLNPVDLQSRAGVVPQNVGAPPYVPGWDVSGVVAAVGPGVTEFAVGDRVYAMSAQAATGVGTAAQFVRLGTGLVGRAPESVDLREAASVPLAALTAEQALGRVEIPDGGTLVVVGAAGAVGAYVVILAKRRGLRVVGVGRPGDVEQILALGADEAVPAAAGLAAASVDAVLDAAGVPESIAAVRAGGCFVTITPRQAPEAERDVRVVISYVDQDGPALSRIAGLVDEGVLPVRVAKVFPFEQAATAHELFEAGGLRGKVLLVPQAVQSPIR
jgi:NADPH2:quinone reductase